jgi:hypothetical protein
MFNTVAQGETTPMPTAAEKPTPTAEVPVVETPPKRSYVRQDDRVKEIPITQENIESRLSTFC